MYEGPGRPTGRRMTAARPRIVALVVVDMEIEPEAVDVLLHGTVEIGDREDHRDKPFDSWTHPFSLPR